MMNRSLLLLISFALFPLTAAAQEPADPAACWATEETASALPVTHGDRTYYVTDQICLDAFLAEPERYAQLFDALAELEAAGRAPVPETEVASLVPS